MAELLGQGTQSRLGRSICVCNVRLQRSEVVGVGRGEHHCNTTRTFAMSV